MTSPTPKPARRTRWALAPLPVALSTCLATAPAHAAPPRVVADSPAVGSLAALVMGDLGAPVVLLSGGADPHDFQLRPSQAMALAGANILFWVGPAFTPWLERAIEGVGLRGESVALLQADGVHLRSHDEAVGAHDHDHGHGHGHGADADSGIDPHAWLDPFNAAVWVDVIAARLSGADPENAAVYADNAKAARARLTALDADLAEALRPVRSAPLIVFHDAYGYFAEHFGLTIAGSIALGDAASPGAGRIAAIRETLIETGAACVFPEVQHDPALVRVVIEGTGARMGGALDPAGASIPSGPDHYETLMRGLAQTILACLRRDI
jgi:zinc transport system substrate-binding protein